jgi:competence protein ComEA
MSIVQILAVLRWPVAVLAMVSGVLLLIMVVQSAPAESVLTLTRSQPTGQVVSVYVSGAVRQPGVVQLPAGSRISDAVQAAGGATEQAELARINLALRVRDEQQVHVPTRNDGGGTASVALQDLVNLNTATAAQLTALRGIGDARARAIIAHREKNGRFGSIDELVTARLIPASVLADIRDQLAVD